MFRYLSQGNTPSRVHVGESVREGLLQFCVCNSENLQKTYTSTKWLIGLFISRACSSLKKNEVSIDIAIGGMAEQCIYQGPNLF